IKTSERLPENSDMVQVMFDVNCCDELHQSMDHDFYENGEWQCHRLVTHWMPLPLPPLPESDHE
ncbi:MAG TPA: DUF551 domain-containing protein, partial [Candidatus Paceibacterota bacterium]